MALNVKSFARLVEDQAAAIQTKSAVLVDFTVGSILRSIVEANAAVALWLQGLILYVLSVTRLSTSYGSDVDSWLNDWGVTRLGATLSVGQVTFSRFTPTNAALVPVGAKVQTADGTQTFQVTADTANASWSASQNGYLVPAEVVSVTVPVTAVSGSVSGNVVTGAVNVMVTAISGVDYCSNAAPFAGGSNAETDAAAKARFPKFIQSLSKGTDEAIEYAIESLQLGLQCTILENVDPSGTTKAGYLTVTVDDGSGTPSQAIIDQASAAAGATRACGIMWGVFSPIILYADIAIVIATADGYDRPTVVGTVNDAIAAYVNTLPLGQSLQFLKLAQVIYEATPGVSAISSMTLNNSSADLVASARNTIKIDTLTVA